MTPDRAAIAFLVLVSISPWIWAGAALKRSPYTTGQSVLYFANVLLTRVLWRASVPRQLPLTPGQGAVLVANHRSSVDPFFIQLAAGRVVHWMVAREYFNIPGVGSFLRATQAIPTRRAGQDTAATRQAIRLAANGELLGILPEGRINDTDKFLLPVRPGAAWVALRARVPVVPCYIEGSPYDGSPWSPFRMPARVRVLVGEPIDLSAYYGRENEPGVAGQLTVQFMTEVAKLAGRPDVHPQLAGRRWKPDLGEEAEFNEENTRQRGSLR